MQTRVGIITRRNQVKAYFDEFSSSNPEPYIVPDVLKSLVDQLSIEPNKSKQTKQEAVKLLTDVLSKENSSATWSEDEEFLLSTLN